MEQKSRKFILTKKLGEGAFGETFQGIDLRTKEEVAVKMEKRSTDVPQLFYEAKLYEYLWQEEDAAENGIPRIFYCCEEGEHNILVMELLGSSLEDLFNKCNRKFSMKTVLLLGEQMLSRVEYLHKRRFLHRDLKPDNFLMGRGKKQQLLYLIDYGLAKKYISRDGVHIPYKEGKSLTGTARYASVNTHIGIEQGRRDDLEAVGYIMMYFLRGSLPWQNLKTTEKTEKYKKIMEKKIATSAEVLCKGFPSEFAEFITYTRSLKFDEKPNYEYLRKLLRTCRERLNITNNLMDWMSPVTEGSPLKITNLNRMGTFDVDAKKPLIREEKDKTPEARAAGGNQISIGMNPYFRKY